jgi:hypothetical protein
LALSRVDRLLPESILHSNKEMHFNNFSPRLATSAAPGWASTIEARKDSFVDLPIEDNPKD